MKCFSCSCGQDRRTRAAIHGGANLCILLIFGQAAFSAGRTPVVLTTDDVLDLNALEGQAAALLKNPLVSPGVAGQFRARSFASPPPLRNNLQLTPNKHERETITDTHKAEKHLAGGIVSSLVSKQANVGVLTPSAAYLLTYEARRSLGNGYVAEPIWNWTVDVKGAASDSVEDQKQSRVQSIASLRAKGAAVLRNPNEDVAVVGTYRENEHSTYGRIAFLGSNGKWGFDQVYGHKDTTRSEFRDVIYLDDTNELLILGNADNKLWLLKLDIESKWVLWDRVYDLIKFRVSPIPQGMTLKDNLKLQGAKLSRTPNGEIVVVGTVTRQADTDLLVLLLTPQGKIRWARGCGGTGVDSGKSAYAMSDGSIVVGGQTSSKQNQSAGWLLKLDNDGYVVWEKAVASESVEGIYPQKLDWFLLVDFWWDLYSVYSGSPKPFAEKENWQGERAWTKSGPFMGGGGNPFAEAALTCVDLLFVPSMDDALAGKPVLDKMIRDRRKE
jgi:hypothetical protein